MGGNKTEKERVEWGWAIFMENIYHNKEGNKAGNTASFVRVGNVNKGGYAFGQE